MLSRAEAILNHAKLTEGERAVRIRVVAAALIGNVITPNDDNPEARNPIKWTLDDDAFVVSSSSTPVEAIADLWEPHQHDNVPIPRIWCNKYASLTIAQGYIQYFRDTRCEHGLTAINNLIGQREFPHGLPHGGDGLFWTRRRGSDQLLPGDQVWFENPYFDRGSELIYQETLQQALEEGKSATDAIAVAESLRDSFAVGEEGSNVFYIGDGRFLRGATSVAQPFRSGSRPTAQSPAPDFELAVSRRVFGSLSQFQKHMIDDYYTVQAAMRASPGLVRPHDFQIQRVRSPQDPDVLLRATSSDPGERMELLIDAVASRNKPPQLAKLHGGTVPQFDDDYDWGEQQRVRSALVALLRTKSDDLWWRMFAARDDNRYVLTATRDGVAKNFTLGDLCGDIAMSQLCTSFISHLPTVPGRLPPTFHPEAEFWKRESEWLRERKSLCAMQIVVCQRALDEWKPIVSTLAGRDGRSHIYTTAEKARYTAALVKEIADRKATQKAAYSEILVPWLVAPSGWEGFDAETAAERQANRRPAVDE